ncbi:MAG: hypothetical protein HYX22_02070 [Candidatus Yanofskybacteria bacterium]|nr:hypothetical protein [Candidatus Yanofskybacteria bacterium]
MEERADQRVSVELPKEVVLNFRDQCHRGAHPWKKIFGRIQGFMMAEVEVVRWCPICGSVVIDLECDDRIQPGAIRKIESSQISSRMSYKGT